MEVLQAIQKRQSVRKFKAQDIPDEDIRKLIEAAGLAPSGKNCQNWHFVVIKNRQLMQKIADTILEKNEKIALKLEKVDEEKASRFRKFAKNFTVFYLNAPVLILTYAKDYVPSGYDEYHLIQAPKQLGDNLFQKNPGMQGIGAALENLTLRAIDLGYGVCWLTSQNYAADEIEALVKEETALEKENYYLTTMLALGVPESDLKSPRKKDAEDIYTLIK
ncbi:nitroreductase family protein [Sinanaerobacter sp. ZZT-01]|uniref:nitroreductase family protein n=1 Tax=Sinanaerobacter sp. ZZT-01 TaxID=3111540 RepID=UPI002D77B31C|nr:nitroreductase family protein [Sinanaerobacter sp. ZZT-01]WRR94688.1 nitroreductase family protein [Sinanaerobacter sp. ZZT-01]